MAYERERTRITAATVARAKALVARRAFTGRGLDIVDEAMPGLVLRVGPQGARWMLKARMRIVKLGPVDSLTPGQARIAAARARGDLADGADPAEAVEVYSLAISSEMEDPESTAWGPAPVDRRARRRAQGPWIVEDLVDAFIEWKVPRLRAGYGEKWARYLRLPEFEPSARVPVRDLRIGTLEQVRDALLAAHPTSTVTRLCDGTPPGRDGRLLVEGRQVRDPTPIGAGPRRRSTVGRRGDRQDLADRLDPMRLAMIPDQVRDR